ncbi:hypothetical protein ACQPW1_14465 [Nocardia sp. CA-128927]|uniref:hypothetical protein n=1 Tax=Nocardia sp. CA-128927 TaxID=3239975 RepID=UPI003D966206
MTDMISFDLRHALGQEQAVVGTVLAAALTPLLRRSFGFGACWLGSYICCGVAIALLGLSTQIWLIAVSVLCYTFGMGAAGISSMSLRQVVTPDRLLGRVTSAFWTAHTALAPAGAAVLTLLVSRHLSGGSHHDPGLSKPQLSALLREQTTVVDTAPGVTSPVCHRGIWYVKCLSCNHIGRPP